ncbi:MAG: molybdopterin molybdotransferase MoeA [Chitinophagales bacterium]|nr:molybdopterin molybdotransferase MoeA [Chitinophagales bacterium]MBP9548909.1 molybdopterin molybdotransferase MoeA [Chitinophagales bacterium]
MISVEEALQIIRNNTSPSSIETVPTHKAILHVLAEDIFAPMDIPQFNNSAMDGYAFRFTDFFNNYLLVTGEIAAGDAADIPLRTGEAKRIFTGAKMPPGANTVVMQEHVKTDGSKLTIENRELQQGSNVRLRGSQIQMGELAVSKGFYLNAAAIGFIASMGYDKISVYRKPKIHIIVTGNELMAPGEKLVDGKIYESNSIMLLAALNAVHFHNVQLHYVKDETVALSRLLETLHSHCELILITGGVSVGDHDIVTKSKENPHFNVLFHRVKQKPGKPILFGKYYNTALFGLPGNPASVLTCFYMYVIPWLYQFCNMPHTSLQTAQLPLKNNYSKKAGLTHFLKGKISDNTVEILQRQESYILRSFADSDCLIIANEENTNYNAGDLITVQYLPFTI